MRMLAAAINEAKSLEAPKIAAKLEGMKTDVFDGGDGFMRKDDHQFFQPMYIASFGERSENEPFDEEKTGWGWRIITRLDTDHTMQPTSCKMDRPS
jgi:branched-chain amino acid transport system substrate-binding protein